MDRKTVEIYVEISRITRWDNGRPKAYLCSDGVNEFWLPASQVEVAHVKGADHRVAMPEWLAREKGVV